MFPPSANGRELDAELVRLVFMADKQPAPRDDSNRPYVHAPPPHLPPETYAYLIHALLSLQGSASQTYQQTFPHPNHSHPWPPNTAPPTSLAAAPSFYPTNPPIPLPPFAVPQSTPTQLIPSVASTAQDSDGMEDAVSIVEDKRRRNTAASARFRVKKKLKTLSLERTLADLTRRTEELEREASELRRENTWLKEIVLLKGRNLAALNLGSQAPAPADRHDGGEEDDRTHAGSELEPTVRCRGKGKDKDKESQGDA